MAQPITQAHISALTKELANAANIDEAVAQRVLDVLGIRKLVENTNTLQSLIADDKSRRALSLAPDLAQRANQELSAENFRLDNMRLAFRNSLNALDVIA